MRHSSRATVKNPNRVLGVLAAVIVGWALLVPLPFVAGLANDLWWQPWWAKGVPVHIPSFGEIFVLVFFMGLFGLPLSFFFCFLFGYPAWIAAGRRGLARRRDALVVGAAVGAVLDLFLAALKILSVAFETAQHHEPLTKVLLFYPSVALYVVGVGTLAGLAAWTVSGAKAVDHDAEVTGVFA